MVNSALNNKRGVWFKAPVDPVRDNLPNYFEIIKEPMDLGTVRSYLLGGKYESEQDVARDVRLTFSNCMRFNPSLSQPYADAKHLLQTFEKKFNTEFGMLYRPAAAAVPAELPAATTTAAPAAAVQPEAPQPEKQASAGGSAGGAAAASSAPAPPPHTSLSSATTMTSRLRRSSQRRS